MLYGTRESTCSSNDTRLARAPHLVAPHSITSSRHSLRILILESPFYCVAHRCIGTAIAIIILGMWMKSFISSTVCATPENRRRKTRAQNHAHRKFNEGFHVSILLSTRPILLRAHHMPLN
jgi:hypothetical protein